MSSYTTVWDPTSSTYFTLISALFNSSAMLRALFTAYTRTPALQTAPIAAARNFIAPLLYTAQPSPRLAFNPQVATMSSKDDQQPTGMATEGLPKGPEIKEHSQINKEHPAIGIQKEMETPPEITRLPTQHGHQDVLSLEEYMGVGKLKGRRVIITGGDSGIGLSAAVMMAREGAHGIAVVYHPSEQDDADTAKKMIEKEGSKCLLIPVNLAEGEPAAKRIVDQVVGAWNKVDILVNNAAVQHVIPSIVDCDPEVLEKTFKVNIFPMFYLAKHAVPHMVRGSTIINTTSVVAYQGSPSLLEYSSTKGAIVAFTRSLAKQLAPKGIRVNAVAPGPVSYRYFHHSIDHYAWLVAYFLFKIYRYMLRSSSVIIMLLHFFLLDLDTIASVDVGSRSSSQAGTSSTRSLWSSKLTFIFFIFFFSPCRSLPL